VTWEVRTRDAIRRIVRDEDPQAMQTALTVDRNGLGIRLLVIGTIDRARNLEDSLIARVAREVGVPPTVSVVAVPDAHMLREAAAAALRTPVASQPRAVTRPSRPGMAGRGGRGPLLIRRPVASQAEMRRHPKSPPVAS
jgi:hypothetical protein